MFRLALKASHGNTFIGTPLLFQHGVPNTRKSPAGAAAAKTTEHLKKPVPVTPKHTGCNFITGTPKHTSPQSKRLEWSSSFMRFAVSMPMVFSNFRMTLISFAKVLIPILALL